MHTRFYVGPPTVNFYRVQVRERDVNVISSGVWSVASFVSTGLLPPGTTHLGHRPSPVPEPIGPDWLAGYGTALNHLDDNDSGDSGVPPPFPASHEIYNIPWEFRAGNCGWTRFTTVTQRATLDAAGNLRITKGGASAHTTVGSGAFPG